MPSRRFLYGVMFGPKVRSALELLRHLDRNLELVIVLTAVRLNGCRIYDNAAKFPRNGWRVLGVDAISARENNETC